MEDPSKNKTSLQSIAPFIALCLVLIVISGYAGYNEGTIQKAQYFTITSTSTFRTVVTSSITVNTFVTITVSSIAAVTAPNMVKVHGNATTKTLGTSPVYVDFGTGTSHTKANITGGSYFTSLPNRAVYTVVIHYNITPTGVGDCTAGILPLDTVASMYSLPNLSC